MPDATKALFAPGRRLMEIAAIAAVVFAPLAVSTFANQERHAALAAIAAIAFLFVVPAVLGAMAFHRFPATQAACPMWSMAMNTAALIIVCLLLRETIGIGRTSLRAAWLTWTFALLLAAWRPEESLARLAGWARAYGLAAMVGLAAVAAGILMMFPEQFQQCFNEDGTETCELALSLRDHFLPYRELETWDPIPGGRMGTVVVNPSLINSYWTMGLLTLVDDRETAMRLPYWIWSLGGFLIAVRLCRARGRRWWAALPLAALMFLAAANFTFYMGYDRYMADIGNPGVTDALFTMLLLMCYGNLAHGARWAWAVSMLMAALVLYAGPVMFVLCAGAMLVWKPIPRRETLRWATAAGGLLLATAAFYAIWGWRDGSLRYWIDTLDQEYVNHYLADVPRWVSAPLFLGYFALGAGGLAAVGIIAAFRRDAWQKTVATVTLLYLAIVLGSGFKNLHWLTPLWPVPLILLLRGAGARRHAEATHRAPNPATGAAAQGAAGREQRAAIASPIVWRSLAATASILLCIVACWPKHRTCFTLNRDLGRQTTILTDEYLSAATWARIRLVLHQRRQMGWNCDAWTWVNYSEMTSRPPALRPLVLTDGEAPSPEYWLLASRPVEGTATVARLYCRSAEVEHWLRTASSPDPVDRYPWVYRPLAAGDFSPHDNHIQDVQRLGW